MNYLTEIKLFYDWLEANPLPASAISLWHALMSISNRSGWRPAIKVPYSLLELRTGLSRTTIYRERERLRKMGRIAFRSHGGNTCCTYRLIALESPPVFQIETDSATQSATQFAIQCETQEGTNGDFVLQTAFQNEHIYKLNRDIIKEKIKKKEKLTATSQERKSCAKKREGQRFNQGQFLDSLDESWRAVLATWFEYKRLRHESYRSEMGANKCLSLLRRLSEDDAVLAAAIVDQSMANNWAGLFSLRHTTPQCGRQYGQRIGQIMQSKDEQRRQHYIDKLRDAGKTDTETNR